MYEDYKLIVLTVISCFFESIKCIYDDKKIE